MGMKSVPLLSPYGQIDDTGTMVLVSSHIHNGRAFAGSKGSSLGEKHERGCTVRSSLEQSSE